MQALRVVCVVALCLVAVAQAQFVTNIDGISLAASLRSNAAFESLNLDANGNPTIRTTINTINNFPLLPLSARAIYRHYRNQAPEQIAAVPLAAGGEEDRFYNLLLVEGVNLLAGAGANLQVWLQPWGSTTCGAVPTTVCTPPFVVDQTGLGSDAFPGPCLLQVAATVPGQPILANAPREFSKVAFLLPVNRIMQSGNQAAWICIQAQNPFTPTATGVTPIFTNLLYQVAPRCQGDSSITGIRSTSFTANLLLPTSTAADPFPHACRALAGLENTTETSNAYVGAVTRFGETVATTVDGLPFSNDVDYFDRRQRTTCCGWRSGGALDTSGNVLPARNGICINPNTERCCSSREDNRGQVVNNTGGIGKPYNPFSEKCCYGGNLPFTATTDTPPDSAVQLRTAGEPVAISFLDEPCPCDPARVSSFCPASQQCCTFTKFAELIVTNFSTQLGPLANTVTGRCYDPREDSCCNTGEIYNPGSQRCCAVNGLQDINTPCPCSVNSDCGTSNSSFCCIQTAPPVPQTGPCSPYQNYPSGTGAAALQRCLGQCIDTRYQICCNGATCLDEYESCCNATCCNRFTADCKMGLRPGSPGSRLSSVNYNVPFEICTEIESVTPYRATFAYILPAGLLAATFIGMAFSLFFAKRMNALNPLSAYERSMLGLALFAVLLSWPLYFSPMYKYGVVFIWVAFFTIVAALAGLKRLVVVALILQAIVLVYIFDPWGGNEILNLAYHRVDRLNGFGYSGVFLSLRNLWNDTSAGGLDFPGWRCVDFYDGYFLRDPAVEDNGRIQDPLRSTYGYCGREWIAVLLYLSGIIAVIFIVLFVVTLITHAKNVLVKKVISQNPLHY